MIELHETPEERRAKFYRKFRADFGERLRDATAVFEQRGGRKLTRTALAGMLRERTGKPITARYVGRWYRGLSAPETNRYDLVTVLANILNVSPSWLVWGEGERDLPTRGIYITSEGLSFYDNRGDYLGNMKLADPDNQQAIIEKCWELLDLVSPLRPTLRIESGSKSA